MADEDEKEPGSFGNPYPIGKVYDIDGKTWVIAEILAQDARDEDMPYLYDLRDIHTGEAMATDDTDGLWIDPGDPKVRDATPDEQAAVVKWFWHRDANLPNA